jgi:hypothetical protein
MKYNIWTNLRGILVISNEISFLLKQFSTIQNESPLTRNESQSFQNIIWMLFGRIIVILREISIENNGIIKTGNRRKYHEYTI